MQRRCGTVLHRNRHGYWRQLRRHQAGQVLDAAAAQHLLQVVALEEPPQWVVTHALPSFSRSFFQSVFLRVGMLSASLANLHIFWSPCWHRAWNIFCC